MAAISLASPSNNRHRFQDSKQQCHFLICMAQRRHGCIGSGNIYHQPQVSGYCRASAPPVEGALLLAWTEDTLLWEKKNSGRPHLKEDKDGSPAGLGHRYATKIMWNTLFSRTSKSWSKIGHYFLSPILDNLVWSNFDQTPLWPTYDKISTKCLSLTKLWSNSSLTNLWPKYLTNTSSWPTTDQFITLGISWDQLSGCDTFLHQRSTKLCFL